MVENFKDLHCHDGRAFMRLRNGEKKWLDRLFSWSLWLSENEKEFVMKSGDNGNTLVWLEEFVKKRCILHPRAGGESRPHFLKHLTFLLGHLETTICTG